MPAFFMNLSPTSESRGDQHRLDKSTLHTRVSRKQRRSKICVCIAVNPLSAKCISSNIEDKRNRLGWYYCFPLCFCMRRADAHLRAHLPREKGTPAFPQGCMRRLRDSQRCSGLQTSFHISASHVPRPTPTARINLGRTMFILTVHLSTSACWVNGQIYCLTRWAVLSQAASSLPPDSLGWRDVVNMKSTDLGPTSLC